MTCRWVVPAPAGDAEQIFFHAKAGKLTAAADRAAIGTALAQVSRRPHVTSVVSPCAPRQHAISADGAIGCSQESSRSELTRARKSRRDDAPPGASERFNA